MLEHDAGASARVLNMHTLKPIDKEAIKKAREAYENLDEILKVLEPYIL